MPDGKTMGKGEKVYAVIGNDGSVEMRGAPSEVEQSLVKMGVNLKKVDSGKRYLLRKK